MSKLYARTVVDKDRKKTFPWVPVEFTRNGRLKPVEGATSYFVQYTPKGGKRTTTSAGKTLDDARVVYLRCQAVEQGSQELAAEFAANLYEQQEAPEGIASEIDAYLADEIQPHKASATYDKYAASLALFRRWTRSPNAKAVTRKDLLNFMAYLRGLKLPNGERRLSERSIHYTVLHVVMFLKRQGVTKLLNKTDWPKFALNPVKFYADEEIQALRKAADEEELFLINFLLWTGMRKGEARHAEYCDVDFSGRVIRVQEKSHLNWHPKTWENREIPIPVELVEAIAKRRKNSKSNLIFPNGGNQPVSRNTFTRIIHRVAERAGVECDADCHTFRRTFGTTWVEKAPIQEVQHHMGHKSVETTMRYLGIASVRSKETQKRVENVWAT